MEVKRIQNPWVGPSSYQDPAKSDVKVKFCGRENETYDLMHLIDENFLVTLYGKSGNGKTSLLQAGVFPQLRREQYLPLMLRLGMIEEGKSFQSYIKEVIESEIAGFSGRVETVPVIEEQTDESAADHLWNYFARHHYYNKEGDTLFPVIVFDQFEEVLRTRENIKRTEALLSQLNYLIDESHALGDCLVDGEPYAYDFNFRFVISIREDELYRLEDCIDNIYQPSLKRCRYRLNALSREDAETIILTPGREYINSAEQGEIISRIIDSATNKEDGNISPFMLSLICSELFKKAAAANAETPQITVAMIDQLGQNILRDFYLGIVQDLPDSDRIFLEDNLVDANRMRNSVNVGMMNTGCPTWHNLTEGTNRILQATNGKVELVHDQLALAVFEVCEQRKEEERLKDIKRKNRRKMSVISSIAMFALIVIAFMVWQVKKVNYANWQFMENQSRAVAGKAMDLIKDGDSYTACLLALEALPKDLSNPDRPYTPEAESALRLACNNNSFIIEDKSHYFKYAEFSPNGKYILTVADSTIYLWDVKSGCLVRKFIGHSKPVGTAHFSPDSAGARIVSTSVYEHSIRIWNTESGQQAIPTIKGHLDEVYCASFSPDGKKIVSGSYDRTIRIWDASTGIQIGDSITGHEARVNTVYFSPDGGKIVSTSEDATVRLWDANTHQEIKVFSGEHYFCVKDARFSPDGKRIISFSNEKNGTICLWSVDKLELIKKVEINEWGLGSPISICFCPDGYRFATSYTNGRILIWNAYTLEQIGNPLTLTNHANVYSVSYSSDGKYLISASSDRTIRIWDIDNSDKWYSLKRMRTWNVGISTWGQQFDVSKDGRRLIYANQNGEVCIWNTETLELINEWHPHKKYDYENWTSISPDGGRYLTLNHRDRNKVKVFNSNINQELGEIEDSRQFNAATFSPDGTTIATASSNGHVKIWDSYTFQQKGDVLEGHEDDVCSVFFNSKGDKLVSTSWDGTIRVWDLKKFKLIKTMTGHLASVNYAIFSPDDKFIISASSDNTICKWKWNSNDSPVLMFEGHTAEVATVSFDPTGKYIISTSKDKTIRVWDFETGVQILPTIEGYAAIFSSDGNKIIYASAPSEKWVGDNDVRVFEWKNLQQLIDETRERFKDRQLTPEERRKYYLE